MKFKTILPIAALGLLAVIGAIYGGGVINAKDGNEIKQADTKKSKEDDLISRLTVNVRVALPENKDMYENILVTGNLEAIDRADVYPKVPGIIKKVYVKEGQRVKKNKILARIDDEEARLESSRAWASVESARVNMENILNTLERNKELYAERHISPYQYDQYEANYRMARTQYREARAAYRLVRLNFRNTRVKAPISGIVVNRNCEPTQLVSNTEKLFEIANLSKLRVRLNVIEREIPKISVGQPVFVRFDAMAGTGHDREYEGEVESISPMVNPDNGTVEVKVVIPNEGGNLLLGMFARVIIQTRLHEGTMVIRKQALVGEEGAQKVFKVEDKPTGKTAKLVDIKTGLADADYVEILSGLEPDAKVVVEGHNLLNDGDPIRIVE